jgi:gamma-glutamyltranspeptidase
MDAAAEGRTWAIATPHTLATEAGRTAFERGGNAIDAALWAATTLAVVYPHMCGVGGDLFAVIQRPDGETVAIESSGAAPFGLDVEAVRGRAGGGPAMPEHGPDTVTVPGAVAGWVALHEQGGRLPWADAFGQAIAFAFGGVTVAPGLAGSLAWDAHRLAADPGMAATFFPQGRPLAEGDVLLQPALARTLQAIAADGAFALYDGEVGARYAEGLRRAGSTLTVEDLAAHEARLLPPLRGRYRDLDVVVAPPASQGFVLLQILALVERMGIDPDPDGPDAGLLARIMLVASRDRDRHLADPRAMAVHPSTLLDDGHLAGLADEVRALAPATGDGRPGTGDTIALVTADAEGRGVSLIQSLYDGFGSGIAEPSTGIVAHDRGACFTLSPGHPNALAPGKRPAHTLLPAIVQRDGRLAAVIGTMGGHAQPQIDAVGLIRSFVQGATPAEAVAAPRWVVQTHPSGTEPPVVTVEQDVPARTRERLQAAGFSVDTVGVRDGSVGHAHLIRASLPDRLEVGSDPRADGGALAV